MIETSPGSKRRFYTNAPAAFRGARGNFPAVRFNLLRAACGVAEFCYNPERSKQVRDEDA
jgi:hypothetical protein